MRAGTRTLFPKAQRKKCWWDHSLRAVDSRVSKLVEATDVAEVSGFQGILVMFSEPWRFLHFAPDQARRNFLEPQGIGKRKHQPVFVLPSVAIKFGRGDHVR